MGIGRIGRNVFPHLEDCHLVVGDRRISVIDVADPGAVEWGALGIDLVLVLQATRKHRTAAECLRHLEVDARRVILASTPENPDDMDTPLIMGANDEMFDDQDRMIALGSNTSYALAPVLKVFDSKFGVANALFTVIHAFSNQQRLADVPGSAILMSRSAARNVVPAVTNSLAIIERVLPQMNGKIAGIALNVPVADGSNVDLVATLGRPETAAEVNEALHRAAKSSAVIQVTDEPIVSSGIIGNSLSSIFDSLFTQVLSGNKVNLLLWYDNGWGYSNRVVDLIEKLAPIPSTA